MLYHVISIVFIIIIIFMLFIQLKLFFNDIFDKNTILVSKTINFLFKIYNNELSNTEIKNNDNFKKCINNKLIYYNDKKYKLSEIGLSICFQYTNNKFIAVNFIFSITMILIGIYSIYTNLN